MVIVYLFYYHTINRCKSHKVLKMSKIDIGQNCSLTRYLEEVSRLEGDNLKAQLAGALLFGLGYPQFIQKLPDITITVQLVQQIFNASETDLLFDAEDKCVECTQLGSCKVGKLIITS